MDARVAGCTIINRMCQVPGARCQVIHPSAPVVPLQGAVKRVCCQPPSQVLPHKLHSITHACIFFSIVFNLDPSSFTSFTHTRKHVHSPHPLALIIKTDSYPPLSPPPSLPPSRATLELKTTASPLVLGYQSIACIG